MSLGDLLGNLSEPRVVAIARSPKWRIRDYLASSSSRNIRNLLIVHDRTWRHGSLSHGYPDVDLYTHRLYSDSLGSSESRVLTSWRCDRLTRPAQELFPLKMRQGFAGHQFIVSAADSPPFVYKTVLNTDGDSTWDGLEVRLLLLLADHLNFTMNIQEAPMVEASHGAPAVRVLRAVSTGAAELGAGGIYVTRSRLELLDMGFSHTQDCASFIALASVAIPRYRAIMGPFQWTVWLALTLAYLLAILPLVYSHTFSLRILLRHPGQIENMFWYVFGTFTNAFSFKGRDSWTGTDRASTRMLIGWYWVFSIIITACYTGCIISFIAFPAYPPVLDYIWEFYDGGYQIGTLRSDGWSTWFLNSSDPMTDKLLKDMETVPTAWHGVMNVSHSSWWSPYSFLGSKLYLEHVVRTNYTAEGKRSLLHIAKQCFVPFWVSLVFPKRVIYSERFTQILMRAAQGGIVEKLRRDVAWDIGRKTAKRGRSLLQVSTGSLRLPPPEDRMLTLDDTQGMFLLLGAGFAIAIFSLTSENITGRVAACRKHCMPGPRRRSSCGSLVPEAAAALSASWTQAMSPSSAAAEGGSRSSASGRVEVGTVEVECHDEPPASPRKRWAVRTFRDRARSLASVMSWAGPVRRGDPEHDQLQDRMRGLCITEDQVLHLSNAWSEHSEQVSEISGAEDARRTQRRRNTLPTCALIRLERQKDEGDNPGRFNVDSVFGSRVDIPSLESLLRSGESLPGEVTQEERSRRGATLHPMTAPCHRRRPSRAGCATPKGIC